MSLIFFKIEAEEKEVQRYLEEAGFITVTINEFIPGALSRIMGVKPA